MPDMKKVIYDIGRCICHVPYACKECSRYGKISCIEGLLADALELLKEQQRRIDVLESLRRIEQEGQ